MTIRLFLTFTTLFHSQSINFCLYDPKGLSTTYGIPVLYLTYLFNCGSKADTQISPLLSVLSTASPPRYYLCTECSCSAVLSPESSSAAKFPARQVSGLPVSLAASLSPPYLALSPFSDRSDKKRHRH